MMAGKVKQVAAGTSIEDLPMTLVMMRQIMPPAQPGHSRCPWWDISSRHNSILS
jgi:hypothetical protein